jgi:L-alanine-DL-glutamate epimerase-like enolase superfamily enzyme
MQGSRRQFLTAAALAGAASRVSPAGPPAEEGYAPPVIGGEQLGPTALQLKTGLKIRTIETFTRDRTLGIVRVRTDDGSEGYGQLSPYDADISAAVLHRKIAPHALNQDPADVASIADNCLEANYKYPWSFVCRALTGIDTAIWDLLGRLRGKSVCELLGGRPRPLPAYGSSMSRTIKPREEARRLVRLRDERGFRAFKVRVGKVCGHDQDEWPGRTDSLVPAVRKALGNGIAILADGNSCYTPPRAIQVGRMLEEYGYGHFEEPCPYWELEWTARVAQTLKIPVAGGEQDNDLAQWRRMIALRSVDIVQPDICYIGGLTRALRVVDMAAKAGLKCVPHSANLSMVTVFTLHMCAAIPNFGDHFEFTIEEDTWSRDLYSPALEVRDGRVAVPADPGWGVRISPEWLAASTRQITDNS